MSNYEDLQKKDLEHVWHPCSQMKDYEKFPPIIIEKGEGVFLYDYEGNKYMDAVSSWWVNLFGHSNKRINKALFEQSEKLEHVIFSNFSHKPGIELADEICDLAPEKLNKVFFADNGSSAVEIALKLSFQYRQQVGQTKKTKYLALSDAYHGETIGALSVSGVGLYNEVFKPLLWHVMRPEGPDCFRCPYKKERLTCDAECFCKLEKVIEENHEEMTAVIIEPLIQCAAGMKMYSPVYLKKLRATCDKYDVHLIADEVAVGFGRTGKLFAVEHAGISPDFMTLSKGLTAGYLPLSLVLTTDKIYDAFYDDYSTLKAFLHSHSYTGNPLGCAVALETLRIFKEDKVIENNLKKSAKIKELVDKYLMDLPFVGEFRQQGMVGAIELVKDHRKKEGFPWEDRVGYGIYKIAVSKGVLLRPLGNIVYFMPPYIINDEEMEFMVKTTRESIIEFFETYNK